MMVSAAGRTRVSTYMPPYRRYVGEVRRKPNPHDLPDSGWRMVFSGDDEGEAARHAYLAARRRPDGEWRTREIISRQISNGTRDQPPRSYQPEAEGSLDPNVPRRIQLSRRQGWRMPDNTVKVDRSTKWGNPFTHKQTAAKKFRRWIWSDEPGAIAMREAAKAELRGKNLGCWCTPGSRCHADVLLEIANSEDGVRV